MYKVPRKLKNKYSISEYIEGNDFYNSELLRKIPKLPVSGYYTIPNNEYRIDLLTSAIYGTSDCSQILLYYNGLRIEDLKIGVVLKYPSIDDINEMLMSISRK